MKWIGLTGGIATGKSTVADFFREQGVPVVDADRLAHSVLNEQHQVLVAKFGSSILQAPAIIDRKKLGALVFNDQQKRLSLEAIIHPQVQLKVAATRQQLIAQGHNLAIYDVPLLFEKNLKDQFDETILVYLPKQEAMKRLMMRNSLSEDEALLRINSQLDIEDKKQWADVVFDNTGDKESLQKQVISYLRAQAHREK